MAPSKPSCFEVEDWGHTKQISNQRKTESKQRKQSFSPMVVTWDMTELSGFQRTWVEPAFQHDGYQHMYFSLGNCICNFFWTYPIILGSRTSKSFHFNWDLFFSQLHIIASWVSLQDIWPATCHLTSVALWNYQPDSWTLNFLSSMPAVSVPFMPKDRATSSGCSMAHLNHSFIGSCVYCWPTLGKHFHK